MLRIHTWNYADWDRPHLKTNKKSREIRNRELEITFDEGHFRRAFSVTLTSPTVSVEIVGKTLTELLLMLCDAGELDEIFKRRKEQLDERPVASET